MTDMSDPTFTPMTAADVARLFDVDVAWLLPYVWRVRTRLPERFGQPCRVVVRGSMNSRLVEFADGFRVVTSGNYLRRNLLRRP
jgi:hypothetical protein